MHIGLIGGIGPAATEFYYRGLVKAHMAADRRLELTIVHADTLEMLHNLQNDARARQAEIFAGLVARLEAAGAQAAVVTSLGGHFCIEELAAQSALPLINALPVLDESFAASGHQRIGLLGTRNVMESKLYGGVTSVELVAPEGDALQGVHDAYLGLARSGAASDANRAYLFEQGRALIEARGAEAVALAGTDLFLAFDGQDPGYPVIDTAEIHIAAIASASMGGLSQAT